MKKISFLVKHVLMSTLTAVAFAFSFTSCSDELEPEQVAAVPETEEVTGLTRSGESDFNINNISVIHGSKEQISQPFDIKNWQKEKAIFCYVGQDIADKNIYDARDNKQLFGFKSVNLPWSDSGASSNIPQKIWKELFPTKGMSSEDNPWKLVLMNCGRENVTNGNFLGFYNELTGVLRIFYFVPEGVVANGSTHMWGVMMSDNMANRSIFRYGVPNDRNITNSKAKQALHQTDEMAQIITPYKKGKFEGFNGCPMNPGWWAFDIDLSLYRDNTKDAHFTSLNSEEEVLSFKALGKKEQSLTTNSKLLAKLEGSMELENCQASTSGGVFAPIEDLLGKANDIADIAELAQSVVNPNPLKAIENGIKLAKGACDLAGIDYGAETTGFNGYKGTMNLAMDGTIDTKGVISNQENVAGIYPISFKKGDFLTGNCSSFGEGIWNLEKAPVVKIANAYAFWRYTYVNWPDGVVDAPNADRKSPFNGQYKKEIDFHEKVKSSSISKEPFAGYVSFFDPSSIKLQLNPKLFSTTEIENAKVYATCGLRNGMEYGSTEAYRTAQGLKNSEYNFSTNYPYANRAVTEAPFDGLSGSKNKMSMKTCTKFNVSTYKGVQYGAFGCGDSDYIINPMSLKGDSKGYHMMPALEVKVTVVVKKDNGRTLVYSRTYLPEYEMIDVNAIPALNETNLADGCHKNYDKELYKEQRRHIKDIRDWSRHSLHPIYGTVLGAEHEVGPFNYGYDLDNPTEAYSCLIDGDVNTKWCSQRDIMKRAYNTRIYQDSHQKSCYMKDKRKVWYIEFESHFPISPKGYTLVTANDNTSYSHRRPRTWAVFGKKNWGDSWTLLSDIECATNCVANSNLLPGGNFAPKSYGFNKAAAKDMKYFRFEVVNTWSDDDDEHMQLSEFRFDFDD